MERFIFIRFLVREGAGLKYSLVRLTSFPFTLQEVQERLPELRTSGKAWCAMRLPRDDLQRKAILGLESSLKLHQAPGGVKRYFLVRQYKDEENIVYPIGVYENLRQATSHKIIGDVIFLVNYKGDSFKFECLSPDEEPDDLFGVEES